MIAFVVIGLLVGVAIGWVAKPIPPPGPEYVLKTEYDKLKTDYDKLKSDNNATLAQLSKLKKSAKSA